MNRVKVQSGGDTGRRVRNFHLIIPPNLRNLLKESSNLREAPLVMISFASTKKRNFLVPNRSAQLEAR